METKVTVSVEEIQNDLPGYLHRVRGGETLVITQADRPIAEVRPVSPPEQKQRPFGLCAGEFVVPANFDTPLPDDLLDLFEGK